MSGLEPEIAPPPRGRNNRPERIDIGDDVLVRNDLIAHEEGTTERTVNRGDAHGAPFTYVGGVKYRPLRRYQAWRVSRIQQRNPARGPRRAAGRSHPQL